MRLFCLLPKAWSATEQSPLIVYLFWLGGDDNIAEFIQSIQLDSQY